MVEHEKMILFYLHRFSVCPLNVICTIVEYLNDNDDVRYCNQSDSFYRTVIDNFQCRLAKWSLHDYNGFYRTPDCTRRFTTINRAFDDVYYDVDFSCKILYELVDFLFRGNGDAITFLYTSVYHIVEPKNGKTNTVLVHSLPSTGKNFFCDALCAYLLNYGQFFNETRHSNFSFQEAYNRRIILWNEPNYETSKTDFIKNICAGDQYKNLVKNRDDAPVQPSAVIMLTNNRIPLMNDPTFKDRLCVFHWHAAPFLEKYD